MGVMGPLGAETLIFPALEVLVADSSHLSAPPGLAQLKRTGPRLSIGQKVPHACSVLGKCLASSLKLGTPVRAIFS